MKDKILLKTNVSACLVILVGFMLTAVLSYRANYSASLESIQQVSALTSESIYHQISNTLDTPVNISLTMANDSLLKSFLSQEAAHLGNNADYLDTMQNYLHTYQQKYNYDSVFLVSAATARYYNFNGLDRVLAEGDPENVWYYDFLHATDAEYNINVDNDEVVGAENAITLFINCKIKDDRGELLGVVGVGLRIGQLQSLLQSYQDQFAMNAYLVDNGGTIQISTTYTGYERVNLFEADGYDAQSRQDILNWRRGDAPLSFWSTEGGVKQNYIVARYLPGIQWHLVVERDVAHLMAYMHRQLMITVLILAIIVTIILLMITHVIRGFNRQLLGLSRIHEQERQTIFEKATGQLFDDIHEMDITNNRPANQATADYFLSLGSPGGTAYDKCVEFIAARQVHPEFRQGYLDMFSLPAVREAFRQGKDFLRYELLTTNDGAHYYWMRVTARLIVSERDGALHMMTYRQNIDTEKQREEQMLTQARTDEMTGLLNKSATQRAIENALNREPETQFAFFIFDIDYFKGANDRFGHAFGDGVIRKFAATLRTQFRQEDILGRIGGDEFVAFLPVSNRTWAAAKAQNLNTALALEYAEGDAKWWMSASIGVAFAPQDGATFDALYQHADAAMYTTKKRGRGSFTLYGSPPE